MTGRILLVRELGKDLLAELKVTIEDESGSSSEEKVYLPFQASPYVLSFLFDVSQEVIRIAGHTLDKQILQYLVFLLSNQVVDIYVALLQDPMKKFAKEAVIQMWFDLAFFVDVLNGRDIEDATFLREALQQLSPPLPTNLLNLLSWEKFDRAIEWKKQVAAVIELVYSKLDPIDIAFYEPFIKTAVAKCYNRSTILFGCFIQLKRIHIDFKYKTHMQEQHNALVLAPTIPRFSFLPISTPIPTPDATTFKLGNENIAQHLNSPDFTISSLVDSVNHNNFAKQSKSYSFVEQVGKKLTGTMLSPQDKPSVSSPSDPKGKYGLWFL